MAKKTNKKTYELHELLDIDIDAWVDGISRLSDEPRVMEEAYAMAGMTYDKDEAVCPGELENELTLIATRDKYRFDRKGRIVSFDKFNK